MYQYKTKRILFFILLYIYSAYTNATNFIEIANKHFGPLASESRSVDERYKCILVGLVTEKGTVVIPIGKVDHCHDIINESTIFEIGSITKAFLGIILAKASIEEKLKIDEPINHSDLSISLPDMSGIDITWRNLANHTSGLPRLPTDLYISNDIQPYADYGSKELDNFLNTYKLSVNPGSTYLYSNLGAGITGYALEGVYNKNLDELIKEKITIPWKMKDTTMFLNDRQKRRLAPVYLNGELVEVWRWQVLKGAGGLRSTMHDLLIFLQTLMNPHEEFEQSVQLAIKPTYSVNDNLQVGLFWHYNSNDNIIWHNGATYGSSSFIGFNPDSKVGIVVLSNSNVITNDHNIYSIEDASFAMLDELIKNPNCFTIEMRCE